MLKRLLQFVLLGLLLWLLGGVVFVMHVMRMQPYQGQAEAIVVLTGGQGRVETGLSLLAANKARHLLISGAHASVDVASLLKLKGYDKTLMQQIDLGKAAKDTLGNAAETMAWVKKHHIQSLIIVTAHYHMPRTLMHLGLQLPDVALYPYPVVPSLFLNPNWYQDKTSWQFLISEYIKLLFTYPQILLLK
jgi:uncharacterized SAM-binding protein YcdF (DUF218 family)